MPCPKCGYRCEVCTEAEGRYERLISIHEGTHGEIEALVARVAELEHELVYRKNNFEQSCLWPMTIIESDQRMPDGRPTKLAAVPNWCIHKIECNARNPKP